MSKKVEEAAREDSEQIRIRMLLKIIFEKEEASRENSDGFLIRI